MSAGGPHTFLQNLSVDLTNLAILLAEYAERDVRRREREARNRVTPDQIKALLAARYARSAVFGHDLANPGWSLLLELFRADLEERPVNLARLATDARVAATTAFRWITALSASGFVNRMPDPKRPKGIRIALTDAGRDAMEDYFVAVLIGWKKG